MKYNIDDIMDMLDWNNSIELQEKGRCLAKNIRCINVFLQPTHPKNNKNVWENCAKILSERSDEQLSYYLIELLEWLQDLNWPGALCIFKRLKKYKNVNSLNRALNICIKRANDLGDGTWKKTLWLLRETGKTRQGGRETGRETEETGDGSVSPK